MGLLTRGFSFVYYTAWNVFNSYRFKQMGKRSFIGKALAITPRFISCGSKVYIWKMCRIEGVSSYNNQKFSPEIVIDDGVTIQQNLHLTCAQYIYLGRNTAIAANVTITDIHHPYDNINIPIEKQDIIIGRVEIGDDCKIYNNAVILKDTKIGRHCTVGANSVVSGIFPDNCVIVGSPAVIVKRYCVLSEQWKKTDKKGNFI